MRIFLLDCWYFNFSLVRPGLSNVAGWLNLTLCLSLWIKFTEHSCACSNSCIVLGCLHAASGRAEFAGDCLVHMWRTLALCGPLRKGLWTPGLMCSSLESLCVCHMLPIGFHPSSTCDSFCIFSSELSSSSFIPSSDMLTLCYFFPLPW